MSAFRRLLPLALMMAMSAGAKAQSAPLDTTAASVALDFISAVRANQDETPFVADGMSFTWMGLGEGYDRDELSDLLNKCELVALFGSEPKEPHDKKSYLWAGLECQEDQISRLLLGFAVLDGKISQIEMDIFSGMNLDENSEAEGSAGREKVDG